jgi:hypothetical protein
MVAVVTTNDRYNKDYCQVVSRSKVSYSKETGSDAEDVIEPDAVKYLLNVANVLRMDTETRTFWISVIAGVVVMLAFAMVFVNVYNLIPVINPLVGGLVAGLIVRKGLLNGGRAGLVSGIAGGLIVSLDYLLGTGFLHAATIPVTALTGSLFIIVSIIYFAILAFIGGAIGGLVRH